MKIYKRNDTDTKKTRGTKTMRKGRTNKRMEERDEKTRKNFVM
jgi:hypothetical protein